MAGNNIGKITQIISAVFFLVVVYATSMNYRTNILPR